MKQIVMGVLSGLVTAATLLAGAPANAQSIDGWVKAVNKKLDRNMAFPENGWHGVAEATFERGADGRAKAVRVRSRNRAVARAARITLARVYNLPPLPAGYEGKRIKLQMLVGDPLNTTGFHARRKELLAAAQVQNGRLVPGQDGIRLAALATR